MNRDIGKMGESFFENLCNQVDITANRSNVDRFGWDYILEFPFKKNKNTSIDMQEMPIECKVQVKATEKNSGKLQIKLSAMHSLVKYQYPAFICFIVYNNQIHPTEVFLVHIDEDIISKVLKNVRKNEINNKELHKSKITIHYDNSHKLNSIDGQSLQNQIEHFILNGMSSYIKDKKYLLNTIGFNKESMNMKFTFDNSELLDMIDTSLGLKDILVPVQNQKITLSRFNLKMPFDSHFNSSTDLRIKIKPQIKEQITLIIKENKYSSPSKFLLDVYISPLDINGKSKAVMQNQNIQLIIDFISNKHSFTIKVEEMEIYNFLELSHNIKILNLLKKENIVLYLERNGNFFMDLPLDNYKVQNEWLEYCTHKILLLEKIYDELKINKNIQLSMKEIQNNIENIKALYHWLFGDISTVNISYSLEKSLKNDKTISFDKGALLIPITLLFNKKITIIYLIFFTNLNTTNKQDFESIPYERIVYDIFEKDEKEINSQFYLDLQNKLTKELQEDGISMVISNHKYI